MTMDKLKELLKQIRSKLNQTPPQQSLKELPNRCVTLTAITKCVDIADNLKASYRTERDAPMDALNYLNMAIDDMSKTADMLGYELKRKENG